MKMESLSEETWDLVIVGTGLPQALLALSLSRTGLKILHVDENHFYGGPDAGLSLEEAEKWAEKHKGQTRLFSNATVTRSVHAESDLKASRTYTLSLRPQILYAASTILPALVTSRIHDQLEFLAVGSWWTYRENKLQRVPSTREDVFADTSLSRRDKIGLMKFLRFVLQDPGAADEIQSDIDQDSSLKHVLDHKFKVSSALQPPISALTLAHKTAEEIKIPFALERIRRHMRSMNYYGPGFAAVYAKYAGNAEIAQVACRANAVGGAIYLLGHGVAAIREPVDGSGETQVELSNGVTVKAKRVVGGIEDLPMDSSQETQPEALPVSDQFCMIAIISDPLSHLFPPTAENGPVPGVTIVLANDAESASSSPIYLQMHSEDTGECPRGQCCVYASTRLQVSEAGDIRHRVASAVETLIHAQPASRSEDTDKHPDEGPKVLWSMTYHANGLLADNTKSQAITQSPSGQVTVFPPRSDDLVLDDTVLRAVRSVWQQVVDDSVEHTSDSEFMVFAERRQEEN